MLMDLIAPDEGARFRLIESSMIAGNETGTTRNGLCLSRSVTYLLAVFLLVQTLLGALSAAGQINKTAELGFVSVVSSLCLSKDQPQPAHDHRTAHDACCLVCFEGAASDLAVRVVDKIINDLAPPAAQVARPAPFERKPFLLTVGWATSWSSQAPPVFS
jgi:hypothetical protein